MRKNEARLYYKGERFLIWQDSRESWFFSYQNLEEVNTGHRELQSALNVIYESIEDKTRRYPRRTTSSPTWNAKNNPKSQSQERTINLLDIQP